ncbi:cell division protein ZapA [Diaphorobacter sp.]|uniref:cell division protein ZapA n=1 Tax=Diaphorobacter sp. TaxID=1934310 RepID=UPI0028ACA80B|nr:cell division protein ZapA [Diaphorobacter sp.]
MKQIEVKIMEQSYLLSCPDDQQPRMLQAVDRVDSAMTRIRDAGKVRARERIAVLAALNLAFEVCDQEQLAAQAMQQSQLAALHSAEDAQTETQVDEEGQERLQSLLQRLDETLGDDGRLL